MVSNASRQAARRLTERKRNATSRRIEFPREEYSDEEWDRKVNAEHYQRLRYRKSFKIPEEFRDTVLDDFEPVTEADEEMLDSLRQYVVDAPSLIPATNDVPTDHEHKGMGLLLQGEPGVGKTMLACAVLGEIADNQLPTRKLSHGRFVTLSSYIEDCREANGPDGDLDADAAYNRRQAAHKAWYLVLDDLGKEYVTGSQFAQREVFALLRSRYDRGRPTIITTNQSPEEWDEVYDVSMSSFLYRTTIAFMNIGDEHAQG